MNRVKALLASILIFSPTAIAGGNIPFQFIPPPRAKVVYTDAFEAQDLNGGSNQTLGSNRALGAAHPGRMIIFGIYVNDQDPSTINSVTIAGVAATQRFLASNGNIRAAFYTAHVPTGTTGNVVVNITNSGTIAVTSGALWAVTGLSNPTPSDTATSTAQPGTGTLDIPNNGFALGLAGSGGAGGSPTCTWSGLTEVFDINVNGTNAGMSGAQRDGPSSALSISSNWTASTAAGRIGIYASWR